MAVDLAAALRARGHVVDELRLAPPPLAEARSLALRVVKHTMRAVLKGQVHHSPGGVDANHIHSIAAALGGRCLISHARGPHSGLYTISQPCVPGLRSSAQAAISVVAHP